VTDEVPPGDAGAAPGPQGGPPRRQPIAAGRAVALVIVAVVLGVVLLDVGTRAPAGTASTTTTTLLPSSSTTTTTHGAASSTTTTVSHANVTVQVANGVGNGEYAADYSHLLSAAGWNTLAPEDTTQAVSDSGVYYAAGQQAAALSIAQSLGLPRSAIAPIPTRGLPVSSTSNIDVLLIVGPNLTSRFSGTTTT
jgi:hypothetical protein